MKNRIYLPGLNGIRAIAATIVLIFHIDIFLPSFKLEQLGYGATGMAGYGVVLFFVLSGFLITYLMLHEKKEFEKVHLPKFYMRRILRIWPIYYFVVFTCFMLFFFAPQIIQFTNGKIGESFLYYTFFASNIGYGLGIGTLAIRPLWSVGVEEQFYLFWPFLVNKSKRIFITLIGLIIVYTGFKLGAKFIDPKLFKIISLTRFDCMALGGIGAYMVFTEHKFLKWLYNPLSQIIAWGVLVASIAYKPFSVIPFFDKEIHALFYLIIILNVSSNEKKMIGLENKLLDFIGKISYGLYVYHMFILVLLAYLLPNVFGFKPTGSLWDYILVYVLMISCTFGLAYVSFNYFEKWFLKRKIKFTKVHSKSSAISE